MADLNRLLSDNLAIAFGVLAIVVLLLLIGFAVQSVRLGRAVRTYRELVRGTDGGSLHDMLAGSAEQAVRASERMGEVESLYAGVDQRSRRGLQHIGLVRFNPFEDTGSDQSFAIALLDDARDGVVISSLHGRANTRLFAKPVTDGDSPHTLSDEEMQAIRVALEGTPLGVTVGAIDPEQRRVAERLVLAALRKFHREQPLAADLRLDALVSRVRAAAGRKPPPRHRGSARLELTDVDLRRVIDEMAADGRLARTGRRLRLPDARPGLDPEMEARVERLLEGLRAAGAAPPRVEGIASRLGIPPTVIDQLRSAGMLRSIGPGIDYPSDAWAALSARVADMRGPRSIARLRDELRTTRRHAEAILAAMERDNRAVR